MTSNRILLIDIETAPIEAYCWGIWDENIGLNQIKKDWHLLSFAAKWLGEKEVIYFDQSKRRDMSNDTHLLKRIHRLLTEAWIVVAQNGDAFDLCKIRSRMIRVGIDPPSSFRTIDTLKVAKKHFAFTSNKLAYLSDHLGCTVRKDPHQEFPGFDLWKECLKRNEKAWKVMKRYNIDDVLTLEEVYLKMRPWIERHPNVGVFNPKYKHTCPKCGSDDVQSRGVRCTQVQQFTQYRCNKCGGWSYLRVGNFDKAQRQAQLGN
jgi:predicted RNA-binding Zn-ribbon protein involved in translation (DUF1610 family)